MYLVSPLLRNFFMMITHLITPCGNLSWGMQSELPPSLLTVTLGSLLWLINLDLTGCPWHTFQRWAVRWPRQLARCSSPRTAKPSVPAASIFTAPLFSLQHPLQMPWAHLLIAPSPDLINVSLLQQVKPFIRNGGRGVDIKQKKRKKEKCNYSRLCDG